MRTRRLSTIACLLGVGDRGKATTHLRPRRAAGLLAALMAWSAAALLLTLALSTQAAAAPPARSGDLDSSFGTDGKVFTDFDGPGDFAAGVALQDDRKIVVAGCTRSQFSVTTSPNGVGCAPTVGGLNPDFALARYDSNGALDPTFGVGGTVTTDFENRDDGATDVAIQSDGRIVAAGHALTCLLTGPGVQSCGRSFALARYNADGSLDPTFGGDGKVTTLATADAAGFEAYAVAIQPDGNIIVAGVACNVPPFTGSGCPRDFALARYLPTGALDPTFGGDGVVLTDFGDTQDFAFGVALQGDGSIVAAGQADTDFALARYLPTGALDTTFGGGTVTTDFASGTDGALDVAVQIVDTDVKIVAAGFSSRSALISAGDFALARYDSNGSLDSTFGDQGKVTTDFKAEDRANAVQIAGKIVAAGFTCKSTFSGCDFALARYDADGAADKTFGRRRGTVTTDFGGNEVANDLAIQPLQPPDSRIVAAGHTSLGDGDFALAGYLP